MSYIKTTNIVKLQETKGTIKTVRCPYCYTFLENVPKYVTALLCWHCNKEFRVEQDSEKWNNPDVQTGMHTIIGRIKRY